MLRQEHGTGFDRKSFSFTPPLPVLLEPDDNFDNESLTKTSWYDKLRYISRAAAPSARILTVAAVFYPEVGLTQTKSLKNGARQVITGTRIIKRY